MEYPKKSISGDAGEYLVAYTVTHLLGWPCRLLDVDIGVDAEMEIMGDDGNSTGDVIKIQVKSFSSISSVESKSIYVDERHIRYWKRFCLPVIVCCVDLAERQIYWKQIVATDNYVTSGEANRIRIDLNEDKLDSSSKERLKALATPEDSKKIEPLFAKAIELHDALLERSTYCVDGEILSSIELECNAVRAVLDQIKNLILHFPWRASTMAMRELARIERNVQIIENDAAHSFAVWVNGG